jgi:hypothetical protein
MNPVTPTPVPPAEPSTPPPPAPASTPPPTTSSGLDEVKLPGEETPPNPNPAPAA